MATFIAPTILLSSGELPDDPPSGIIDTFGDTHRRAIDQLVEIAVIGGVGSGSRSATSTSLSVDRSTFGAGLTASRPAPTITVHDRGSSTSGASSTHRGDTQRRDGWSDGHC